MLGVRGILPAFGFALASAALGFAFASAALSLELEDVEEVVLGAAEPALAASLSGALELDACLLPASELLLPASELIA